MDIPKVKVEPNRPTCEQCKKEIPPSAAKATEAEDYIHHFCGNECYLKWKRENADGRGSDSTGKAG